MARLTRERGRAYSLLLAGGLVLAGIAAGNAAAKQKALDRPDDPVVLTGTELPRLLGADPDGLAAYRFKPAKEHGRKSGGHSGRARRGKWVRIPVQVDERAQIDFGSQPPSNATPPSGNATVYGTAPIGIGVPQYTDPNTFVGPDPNPTLDGDDEVALMASDAGAKAPKRIAAPPRVRAGGATTLTVSDSLTKARGWVYLFRAGPKLKPLGTDYVDYDFHLLSGDYKSTYHRASGPNPESSTVRTADYRVGYSDRWFLDTLAIDAGSAGGQDILDGVKSGFAPGSCARSEATYNSAEGAFVVNKDGPVRAIRSYVGANSGPLTQRTDVFYASRQEVRIDLRVHPIGSIMSYIDLGPGAFGMTYRNSASPGGVAVDGVNDAVSGAPAAWHLWSGGQGSLFSSTTLASSFANTIATGSVSGFYRDELNTSVAQCWGDDDLIGSAGTFIIPSGGLPNTDPRSQPTATLHAEAINLVSAPGAGTSQADAWFKQLGAPLSASPKRFRVKS